MSAGGYTSGHKITTKVAEEFFQEECFKCANPTDDDSPWLLNIKFYGIVYFCREMCKTNFLRDDANRYTILREKDR
ncbi:hypothetical protein A2972_02120 [Candidatus Amesbacteria bacterium RIFCSPLOWO2_01_FULL_47_33]|uniref:TRASH domain-containing protein n=1 Tax=Candidatus Amesbacteria bacterium RIFCSPLOWO2_01_FULL_47_33 TaxID=1797258 RepID=A0A1F4Z391_9BACT|nr:MAG: hypothetical protein A2972_02120 [Candidatus Amesbacteria bacterium RIFCSPLOWO2_01_FULL_47_33]